MSEPTPTTALNAQDEIQKVRDGLIPIISALAWTFENPNATDQARFHAIHALVKLAEDPALCEQIACTALAPAFRWIQLGVGSREIVSEYWPKCIVATGTLYHSLRKHMSEAPAAPTPTGSALAPVARPAARDIDDWELASSS
ncbi:hypothetical protein M408DRAFT_24100 [Serendipita vermifera MAFF 305830]|uniref:Uncharacterized protein n=1 Tax=Serendipita vermifera MAFF 305830 TaxID=933852 RepID=A0A0C3B7H4_SERVB|nr:hypothetical protein M408DRAFT_24100 [Serendipita vermifera MAFF 305830]